MANPCPVAGCLCSDRFSDLTCLSNLPMRHLACFALNQLNLRSLARLRDREVGDTRSLTYLQTQVRLITSDKVLNHAVADALVVNLPTIKKSEDPKNDLRKLLQVEIVKDANLIRVALELAESLMRPSRSSRPWLQSYLTQNSDYSRSANRELTESLTQQLTKLAV